MLAGGSLRIVNLTVEDSGTFSCLADNMNDSLEAKAELNIQGTVPSPFFCIPD